MKHIAQKDLTTVSVGVVLHGVNCQGVMGAGIARALADKYPKILGNYSKLCAEARNPYDLLGEVDYVEISPSLTIANCFTQNFFGISSKPPALYSAIQDCLANVARKYQDSTFLFMPPIGCGLGGLTWTHVNDIVEYVEQKYGVYFNVCDLTVH
jgi:O-acetyl-ADP-ribose deacetylase (regulator of RNase III)